jgi:hypothetical protein
MEKSWELVPRLFLQVEDGPSRLKGRVVFSDFATDLGALGMPADSPYIVTVGAADPLGRPELSSTAGPPLNRGLLAKPTILAFDTVALGLGGSAEAFGTGLATPFAAGLTTVEEVVRETVL